MEIMIQWFWLVKLLLLVGLGISIYKLAKSKFKSKLWLVMTFIGIAMMWISPVKMETNTRSEQVHSNHFIKQSKELPPLVKDSSFNDATAKLPPIQDVK